MLHFTDYSSLVIFVTSSVNFAVKGMDLLQSVAALS